MRFVVVGMLMLILGSLFSGLYYLLHDKGNSDRAVRALTVRIALSITLFLVLMAGYYFGFIPNERL
jgi:Protein of unknown function (DUF2909)